MKRMVMMVLGLGMLVLGGVGCGDNNQAPEEAQALWDRIQAEDYQNFARAPGYETTRPSAAPHGANVDIYVNEVVQNVLAAGEPIDAWPLGSLIVKDGFNTDGELEIVAVMDKRESGWFYAEWIGLDNTDADYSGQPAVCVNCHASGADEVRAFGFPGGE